MSYEELNNLIPIEIEDENNLIILNIEKNYNNNNINIIVLFGLFIFFEFFLGYLTSKYNSSIFYDFLIDSNINF